MRTPRLTMCLLASLPLAGCAGIMTAMEYPSSFSEVTTSHDTFRVFDLPDEGRVMVTSSIDKAMEIGKARGEPQAVFSESEPGQAVYQEAAEKFFLQTGRHCVVLSGELLIVPQWEFKYRCDAPARQ